MNYLDTVKPAQLYIRAFLDSRFTQRVTTAPNEMTAHYSPESLSFKEENTGRRIEI